jgi:thiamine kinase-like enzyme
VITIPKNGGVQVKAKIFMTRIFIVSIGRLIIGWLARILRLNKFPGSAGELTNEWLTGVLRKNEIPEDVLITGFTVEPIGDPGALSDVVRIGLKYNKECAQAPSSLIGKFRAESWLVWMYGHSAGLYYNEFQFFKQLATKVGDLAPKCYAAEFSGISKNFVLLLEDLADLRLGEALVSNPDDSQLMLEKIAPFHAHWWDHPGLDTFDWMLNRGKDQCREIFSMLRPQLMTTLSAAEKQFKSSMPDKAWRAYEKYLARMDEIFEYDIDNTPYPLTIYHGDYHYQQCFFPTDINPRFAVVDWQIASIGPAAIDVARVLLALSPEDRRTHEKSLVENYYKTLKEYGIKGYSLEQLWECIHISSFPQAMILIGLAGGSQILEKIEKTVIGRNIIEEILYRLGSGLVDWDVSMALDQYLERASTARRKT